MSNRGVTFLFGLALLFLFLPNSAKADRLWSSGCEFQGDTGGAISDGLEWELPAANSLEIYQTIKRSGLSSCRASSTVSTNTNIQYSFSSATVSTDMYFRFYLYINTAPSEDVNIFQVWDIGVDGAEGELFLEADRQLHWGDDELATDGQGTTVLNTGQWYRIEINYDAADQVLVYIDGVQELDSGTHTGDPIDSILWGFCGGAGGFCGGDGATVDYMMDDWAINNTSGTSQTGLPGAGSIVHMQPDGGGDNNGCSAGTFADVDEITPDDNTTFCNLDADTGGDLLDVNTESSSNAGIGSNDTVTLVQVGIREAGVTAAAHTWEMRVKSASGGSATSGTTISSSLSTYSTNDDAVPRNYSVTAYVDPTTAVAWTPTGTNSLDNMQIGLNASDGAPDIKVSTLWGMVEYVPGASLIDVRQEINITDAYLYVGANSYATSSEIVAITDNNYTAPAYYFEVVASTTGATTATVDLVNATSSAVVATITMTSGSTVYDRFRSAQFLPNSSSTVEYKVRLNNENVGKGLIASRIVVLQNTSVNGLSETETQIEIGSATTTASNTTTLALQDPKYWSYNDSKWNGSPTFSVEVTYKNNPTASSTTYNVTATATPTFYTYRGSAGVGYVVGEAWGGGGGGDGATSAATLGGGGGGGGTYARATTTVEAGSTNRIGVGRGGAEGVAKAVTASSTLTTASGLILAAEGGEGATTGTGAATSSLASSIGTVIYAGGSGGNGQTDTDTGGGGGGSAGPDGYGISGLPAASNGPGGNGGAGDRGLGGAGGAGGNGGDDTCDAELGLPGTSNVLGAGGGGGADGDANSICSGGNGGSPGGGGGGSDEGATGIGGPGQVKITEWIGTTGIAIQEDDGNFGSWTFKTQIVVAGLTSTTSERVRVSFTPSNGKHYRIVASTTNATASYSIYNAKIVVYQTNPTLLESQYLLAPYQLLTGTALQKKFTLFDPADWTSATNAYLLQADAADNSASDVLLQDETGATTYVTLSNPDNSATTTLTCIPSASTDWDTLANSNNDDVFSVRVLVQVGGTQTSACVAAGGNVTGNPSVQIRGQTIINGQVQIR